MARILLAKARFTTLDQGSITPPLGAMYIAAVLCEAGHEVRIFESRQLWWDLVRFRKALLSFRPDVLGLSAITFEAHVMEAMADEARDAMPDLPIVVGSPHASAYPHRCALHPSIDHAVVGEGERTMLELVQALVRGGADPRAVHGVVSANPDGTVHEAPDRASIDDLDALPFPAWDLVDVGYYAREKAMSTMGRRPYMALFTSRGCP